MPTVNQLLGDLNSGSVLKITISAANFSSQQVDLKINGSASFTIRVEDFFEIGVNGSASYDMSRYTGSSSSLEIEMDYTGLSIVQADPTALSADGTTGWYDDTLLRSIVNGSNSSSMSGFKINSDDQWNVNDTFGEGKIFSRLKTLVISNFPTVTMTFSAGNGSTITSDFQEKLNVNLKLFGLFDMGSVSETYKVSSVDSTSVAGKITVVLAPPTPTGTIPLDKQVCYIVGGVPDYPPDTL